MAHLQVVGESGRLPSHQEPEGGKQRLVGRGRGGVIGRKAPGSSGDNGRVELRQDGAEGVEGVGAACRELVPATCRQGQ